jgi:hypothetical protein
MSPGRFRKVAVRCTFGVLVVGLILSAFVVRQLEEDPVYGDKSMRLLVQAAVLDDDAQANTALLQTLRSAPPDEKAQIKAECTRCTIKGLKARDNVLWRPYNAVRAKVSPGFRRFVPAWREPSKTRRAAAWWVCFRAMAWNLAPAPAEPEPPGFHETVAPVLCNLARRDRDPNVRHAATWGLGSTGIFSPEAFSIMASALGHADPADRRAGLRWFRSNPVNAERIVPLLVHGLEDDAARTDFAETLRAYGPKAGFVVESLLTLAKTNDRPTASVASWALGAIDPAAAKRAGVSLW